MEGGSTPLQVTVLRTPQAGFQLHVCCHLSPFWASSVLSSTLEVRTGVFPLFSRFHGCQFCGKATRKMIPVSELELFVVPVLS